MEFRISELAGQHGLSRSTLLYYDRIGLLTPSYRTSAGYRLYSQEDAARLQTICCYREAGLTLADIRELLDSVKDTPGIRILENRLNEVQSQMHRLQIKQATLLSLIKSIGGCTTTFVSKDMWTSMLRSAGMDDRDMIAWHAEFERSAPHAHEAFLQWLGIPCAEIRRIRRVSGKS